MFLALRSGHWAKPCHWSRRNFSEKSSKTKETHSMMRIIYEMKINLHFISKEITRNLKFYVTSVHEKFSLKIAKTKLKNRIFKTFSLSRNFIFPIRIPELHFLSRNFIFGNRVSFLSLILFFVIKMHFSKLEFDYQKFLDQEIFFLT